MKKSILLLINGLGIERKDSIEIYNASLMPNLDYMTKNYLFGSLSAQVGDYNNGYRLFSITQESEQKEDAIDKMIFDKTLSDNPVLNEVKDGLTEQNKLHLYYFIDKGKKINQVKEILKVINPNKDKNIYMHLILKSANVDDYNTIEKSLNRLAFELGDYAKIGFIVGKNKLSSDETSRTILKELGEHWNEHEKKVEILKRDVVNPEDASVFYVNNGFALQDSDIVMFINYDDIEADKVVELSSSKNLGMYSLYEYKDNVKNVFKRDKKANESYASLSNKFGVKTLLLTDSERINDVNFYLNGMENITSPNITFAAYNSGFFSSKEAVINLVENNAFDGIIIDFQIGLLNKVEDIKNALREIDAIIKPISDASLEKGYTFMISSLYGMHAQVMDGVLSKVINFSLKVPLVFQSNDYPKSEYSLNPGDTYDLALLFLTTINEEVKGNRLVHKRSALEKLLSRK